VLALTAALGVRAMRPRSSTAAGVQT
jgi:hypothetical protein